jgi:hypothetical protein
MEAKCSPELWQWSKRLQTTRYKKIVTFTFTDVRTSNLVVVLSCFCGVPFLMRGLVCHLSFSVCSNLSVFTSSILKPYCSVILLPLISNCLY